MDVFIPLQQLMLIEDVATTSKSAFLVVRTAEGLRKITIQALTDWLSEQLATK